MRAAGWLDALDVIARQRGTTAAEYAAQEGIHPGTLTHWKWKLRRDARERRERVRTTKERPKGGTGAPTPARIRSSVPHAD